MDPNDNNNKITAGLIFLSVIVLLTIYQLVRFGSFDIAYTFAAIGYAGFMAAGTFFATKFLRLRSFWSLYWDSLFIFLCNLGLAATVSFGILSLVLYIGPVGSFLINDRMVGLLSVIVLIITVVLTPLIFYIDRSFYANNQDLLLRFKYKEVAIVLGVFTISKIYSWVTSWGQWADQILSPGVELGVAFIPHLSMVAVIYVLVAVFLYFHNYSSELPVVNQPPTNTVRNTNT